MNDTKNRRSRRRSFSMAEAALAVIIVGMMMVAALNMVAMSARARTVNAQLGKAPALAHGLLSEVLQAYYEDPDIVPVKIESPESTLTSHDPAGGNIVNFTIKDKDWVAQYFQPSLPPNAVSWSVTKVRFLAKAAGPKKWCRVCANQ